MSLWQRVRNLWTGELLTQDGARALVDEAVSKALDAKSKKLIAEYGVDLRGRHIDPHRAPQEAGGKGPRKQVGFPADTLRAFARNNPWLRAIIDTRKREVGSADWQVVPALDEFQKELDDLQALVHSARQFEDRAGLLDAYRPLVLKRKMVAELIEATRSSDLTNDEVRQRFHLALQDRKRDAERNAAKVRRLLKFPHRDHDWPTILRAILPDLLILDSACLELRRTALPMGEDKLPLPDNPIVELHWVDGATVRPVIDKHGQLAGRDDPTVVAYEQWIRHTRVQDDEAPVGWRACDLLRMVENPQTDIQFLGHGLGRVEALVFTSFLEAMADKEDAEEYRRGMYGGFLHIKDKAWQQEDIDAFRDYIEEELEGTKKLPLLAVEDAQWINTSDHALGRDKKSVEKLKRYVFRCCAMFQFPPVKLAIYEDANYSTSRTQQDIDDDGLRELLLFVGRQLTNTFAQKQGFEDVEVTALASHTRDEEERNKNAQSKGEMGVWTVNDIRAQFDKDPVEGGEKPLLEAQEYWKAKGQAEGFQATQQASGETPDSPGDREIEEDRTLQGAWGSRSTQNGAYDEEE